MTSFPTRTATNDGSKRCIIIVVSVKTSLTMTRLINLCVKIICMSLTVNVFNGLWFDTTILLDPFTLRTSILLKIRKYLSNITLMRTMRNRCVFVISNISGMRQSGLVACFNHFKMNILENEIITILFLWYVLPFLLQFLSCQRLFCSVCSFPKVDICCRVEKWSNVCFF